MLGRAAFDSAARYDALMFALCVTLAWVVGVACCAPVKFWAPLMAVGPLCVTAETAWPGKRWVLRLLSIVTVIYCLQDMWRRGDEGGVVTFAAMFAALVVVSFIRWHLSSSRRGEQAPSP
jgi:hypothetical protein